MAEYVEDRLVKMVELAFRQRTEELLQEETEKAVARVRKRLANEVDVVVLQLMSYYQVRTESTQLVVTVDKKKFEQDYPSGGTR